MLGDAELLHSIPDHLEAAGDAPLAAATNDARSVEDGGLFVALQGTKVHGVLYAQQAFENGAAAMLAGCDAPDELVSQAAGILPVIRTSDDAVTALGRLARAWRDTCSFTVVGITGSVGKTSTKDMLACMLSPTVATVASHANNNNEIGVPLTLLEATTDTRVVICEMGMRGTGQIDYLCGIARPEIGIVTNAGPAHVELLGTVESVVAAKAELIAGVVDEGTAVVPADQPELEAAAPRRPQTVLRFGDADTNPTCGVVEVHRTHDGIAGTLRFRGGDHTFSIPVHGVHQARNLAAAVCAYREVVGNIDALDEALANIRLTAGRGDRYRLPGDGVLIDDAYNANPVSMRAAVDELIAVEGAGSARRVAVLGPMAELGPDSPRYHAELGDYVAAAGVDLLVAVLSTPESVGLADSFERSGGAVVRFGASSDAANAFADWWQPGDIVLVKASNSAGLGVVTHCVLDHARPEVRA